MKKLLSILVLVFYSLAVLTHYLNVQELMEAYFHSHGQIAMGKQNLKIVPLMKENFIMKKLTEAAYIFLQMGIKSKENSKMVLHMDGQQ